MSPKKEFIQNGALVARARPAERTINATLSTRWWLGLVDSVPLLPQLSGPQQLSGGFTSIAQDQDPGDDQRHRSVE
jgi:hypothetical protein